MGAFRYDHIHYVGMAELKCGNATVSVECLRHANLSNPYNGAVWGLLAESYA